jgi:hypothetical protein
VELDRETLERRVEAGIRWLVEHDDGGAYHLWYKAGINPAIMSKSVSDERKKQYREYWEARNLWEKLDKRLAAMDG